MTEFNNVNYYDFLGLKKAELPYPTSQENRILLKSILDSKFRELARTYHPDRGGDADNFKLLLRAITVLGDNKLRRNYDGEEVSDFDVSAFDIDWEKYFNYNPESLAAEYGNKLAENIANILNVPLIFYPSKKEHGYIWIFNIMHQNNALTLSLVYDEAEILALTDGSAEQKPLPFKVHLYFPVNELKINYNKTNAVKVPGSQRYLISPQAKSISYNDITLLSAANEGAVEIFVQDKLIETIELVQKNIYQEVKDEDLDTKATISSTAVKEKDKQILEEIMQLKTPKYNIDDKADEFLSKIKVKPIKRIAEQTIIAKKA
jgi:curved DNA-binding protein CbpA